MALFQRGGDKVSPKMTSVHGDFNDGNILVENYGDNNNDPAKAVFHLIDTVSYKHEADKDGRKLLTDPVYFSSCLSGHHARPLYKESMIEIFQNFYSGICIRAFEGNP